MAPSLRQLLNGQGVRRISVFKSECHGIRFGTLNVGSLCGRKTEVCEELRKRRVDVCCIQKVRWKGQGARFVGTSTRRYKLWWSGNDAGFGGVGILVKGEIFGNVVKVERKSDRAMAIVLTLGKEVMRIVCAYGPQSGRPQRKFIFMIKWRVSGTLEVLVKSLFLWGISMDMCENVLRVLKVYTGQWHKK